MASEFDTTTKLLLILTGFMAIMVCLIAYVALFRGEDPLLAQAAGDAKTPVAAATAEAEACDASTPEGSAMCPPGKYCMHDKCTPIDDLSICGEGESCRDCDCEQPLVCHNFKCQDPAKLERIPLECAKNEELAKAVRNLQNKCATREKSLGDLVSTRSCTPSDWEALAIDDPQFDLILAAFPGRFSVHFPTGLPKKDQKWPTKQVREHYRGSIARYRDQLVRAKQIFVIGRASPDGDRKENHDLAVRRMDMVTQLIGEVVNLGLSETERKQIPIQPFAMRDAKPLNPERFKSSYLDIATKPGEKQSSPIVAWDELNQRRLQVMLDGGIDLKDQATKDWNELFNAINRVVLVVPIPCDGTEYKPPKTILDDAPAEG
jgi:hypothetical protein